MPGKKPASATPSRKRIATKPVGPVTNAVAAEISPHVIMMRAIQSRAPTRSRIRFDGISKRK
jgi:hypothetical protein